MHFGVWYHTNPHKMQTNEIQGHLIYKLCSRYKVWSKALDLDLPWLVIKILDPDSNGNAAFANVN